MTLRADLDRLHALGSTLHGLAAEAGQIDASHTSSGPLPTVFGTMMTSVLEAIAIDHDLVDGALVPTVTERLGETGDVMQNIANQYREADEATTTISSVMTVFHHATGNWVVPEVPQ